MSNGPSGVICTDAQKINDFTDLNDPEECSRDLEEWFLNYVASELPEKDRESHIRAVNNYRGLQRLVKCCMTNKVTLLIITSLLN